ncbi:MAG: hypothetical protein R3E66_13445 [bacterium]
MVFALRSLSLPAYDDDNVVPSMAIEVWSPGHLGIDGLEVALLVANAGYVDGIQASLLVNRTGRLEGIQAGFFNWADDVDGIQLAWGANVSNAGLMQVAFGANVAVGPSSLQLAGGANVADDVAFQVASVNVGDHADVQIGAVNVADRATLQIGLINVSETSDVPIGLINIMTEEPAYATGWITTRGMVVAGVLHGGKRLRYMYLVAGAPSTNSGPAVGGAGLGLSGHFDFSTWFIDVEAMGLQVANDVNKQSFLFSTHVIAGWQIASRFAVFAGPGLSTLWTTDADKLGLPPDGAASQLGDGTTPDRYAWLEFHAGVRF